MPDMSPKGPGREIHEDFPFEIKYTDFVSRCSTLVFLAVLVPTWCPMSQRLPTEWHGNASDGGPFSGLVAVTYMSQEQWEISSGSIFPVLTEEALSAAEVGTVSGWLWLKAVARKTSALIARHLLSLQSLSQSSFAQTVHTDREKEEKGTPVTKTRDTTFFKKKIERFIFNLIFISFGGK